MDIKTMQYFVAIVENGSFTKAAEQEFISQPALSRRLAELEQELGVRLLERTTRRVALTSAGKICYDSACRLLAEKDHMLAELRRDLKKLEGRIAIWCTWMLELQISSFLSELSKAIPKLEIHFTQQRETLVERELENGALDIVIAPQVSLVDVPEAESSPLFYSRYCAVLSSHHPLAEKPAILLSELSGMPLILYGTEGTAKIEGEMLAMCKAQGFAYSELVYIEDGNEQQLFSAMGKGVGFLPEIAKARILPGVCLVPIKDCTLEAQYACLWRRDNKNPVLPVVLRFLRDWRDSFLRTSQSRAGEDWEETEA